MPCNRRMNHCGGRRGGRFHPYGGHPRHGFHHPFFMMMNEVAEAAEEEIAAALFGKDKARWDENDTNYTFQMDVPGVKAHQVTIEEKDGEIEVTAIRMKGDEVAQTYQDVFYVRPSKADLTNVLATLNEGVLKVIVPKKQQVPVDVKVEDLDAPPAAADGEEFRASVDLPGVKSADLKVQVREDKVYLEATRKVGQRSLDIRRMVEVEPSNTDMTRARAFLQDGVFTLVAPIAKEEEEDTAKPGALRTICVQEEDEVAAFESMTLQEKNQNEYKEGGMLVETVTEDGDKDWEEVDKNNKEQVMEEKSN